MKKIIISFLLGIIVLSGCFGSKSAVSKTSSENDVVANLQTKFPGYSPEDFQQGKYLYETNCNKCHTLKVPRNYAEEEWVNLVPVMSKKSNDKLGSSIKKEDEALIFKYVIAASL